MTTDKQDPTQVATVLAALIVAIGVLTQIDWVLWIGLGAVWVVRYELPRDADQHVARRLWGSAWLLGLFWLIWRHWD